MKQPFHPSLLQLDNAAEEFWQDYKRKQGLPVAQSESADSTDSLWADAHMRFHFPESESEADRLFIESVDKIRAANRALPKVGHRGLLIGLLAGAILWGALGLIVWMVR